MFEKEIFNLRCSKPYCCVEYEIILVQTLTLTGVIIKCWQSFWYVTDGWKVYPKFIEPEDHLVCKTYMTRVEGENTRLRYYLARLHRKTLCYSKSLEMLQHSIRLLLHYLKFKTLPNCI